MEIVQGMGLLIATLGVFSLFSLKAPKGQAAMGDWPMQRSQRF